MDQALRDPVTFYNNVTAYDMLEFLLTNSGGLHDVDLATLPSTMLQYYAKEDSIPKFITFPSVTTTINTMPPRTIR